MSQEIKSTHYDMIVIADSGPAMRKQLAPYDIDARANHYADMNSNIKKGSLLA